MSYFEKTQIQASDSPSIDAFARWRVSSPTTLFDSKQLVDTGSLWWSTTIIGNATASFQTNKASVALIASGSNSRVVRQTKRRFNYQSGKSHLIVCTGNFGNHVNNDNIERIGYFDNNNGIYFAHSGSSFGVGLRTNTSGTPVDTFISQSNWNLDKFDGTGTSGKTLNITASQIFAMDMEWLGVGRVRFGIFQDGIPTYCHQITNTNALSDNKVVYLSNPNLPIRYEIINSGSNNPCVLTHICSTVTSEGGADSTGPLRCVDLPNGNTQLLLLPVREL